MFAFFDQKGEKRDKNCPFIFMCQQCILWQPPTFFGGWESGYCYTKCISENESGNILGNMLMTRKVVRGALTALNSNPMSALIDGSSFSHCKLSLSREVTDSLIAIFKTPRKGLPHSWKRRAKPVGNLLSIRLCLF